MSVLAEAFEKAGITTARGRCEAVMREAIEQTRGKVGEATTDLFFKLMEKRNDPAMERALCHDFRAQAARRLQGEVFDKMRREDIRLAPAISETTPKPDHEERVSAARGAQKSYERLALSGPPIQQQSRPSRRDQGSAVVTSIARLSLLDTMQINKVPLRRVAVIEARKWGESCEEKGRFIRNLLSGVPDSGTVGDFVNDAMAEEAMKLAKEAANA